MRKYASVFGLFAKSSLTKILLTITAMAAAQIWIFTSLASKELTAYNMKLSVANIETLIDRAPMGWILGIAFVLISVLLCIPGTSFSSKTGYTLDRLSISSRSVFFCQAVYNLCVLFILWVAETTVCFGLCLYYTEVMPTEVIGNQSVFLAFFRNKLLHSLLPLSDVWVWIRNAFLLIALSIATAEYPYKQRHKKAGISAIAMVIFTLVFFKTDIVNSFNTALIIVVSVINVIEMCYNFFSEDNSYVGEN